MFTVNFCKARKMMKNNIIRSFIMYVSDYFFIFLFIVSLISVIYLFVFDTTFLESAGVYKNQLILSIVTFITVTELFFLYVCCYYFRLKKLSYFTVSEKDISLRYSFRYSILSMILNIRKTADLFVFMSPFLLTVSALFYLNDSDVSQNVIYITVVCATFLFFTGFLFYSMYILKYSLISYVFLKNPELHLSSYFRISENLTDGKVILFFILKVMNLPMKIFSLFMIPAVYMLPYCRFAEYDFLLQKEKPYSQEMNTDKSVVYYLKECEEC